MLRNGYPAELVIRHAHVLDPATGLGRDLGRTPLIGPYR